LVAIRRTGSSGLAAPWCNEPSPRPSPLLAGHVQSFSHRKIVPLRAMSAVATGPGHRGETSTSESSTGPAPLGPPALLRAVSVRVRRPRPAPNSNFPALAAMAQRVSTACLPRARQQDAFACVYLCVCVCVCVCGCVRGCTSVHASIMRTWKCAPGRTCPRVVPLGQSPEATPTSPASVAAPAAKSLVGAGLGPSAGPYACVCMHACAQTCVRACVRACVLGVWTVGLGVSAASLRWLCPTLPLPCLHPLLRRRPPDMIHLWGSSGTAAAAPAPPAVQRRGGRPVGRHPKGPQPHHVRATQRPVHSHPAHRCGASRGEEHLDVLSSSAQPELPRPAPPPLPPSLPLSLPLFPGTLSHHIERVSSWAAVRSRARTPATRPLL
jgi:hypothetical protein